MKKLLVALASASLLLSACSPKAKGDEEGSTENKEKIIASTPENHAPEVPPLETDSAMQQQLVALIQTLESIAVNAEDQQAIIDEKMEQATTKEHDDEISTMTIKLLQEQQETLKALPLTEKKLIDIRDRLIHSTQLGIEANQDMMRLDTMTPEDEQNIVKKFAEGQVISDEAKIELMDLIKELGMDEGIEASGNH